MAQITPKEKAETLIAKYYNLGVEFSLKEVWNMDDVKTSQKQAKQCALKLVEEIFQLNLPGQYTQEQYNAFIAYWNDVKTELTNL